MLAGRTVCLYGLGAIALPLAKRLPSFSVRLIGISRGPRALKIAGFGLTRCFSLEERDEAFATTDILVLCMRYTESEGWLVRVNSQNSRVAHMSSMLRGEASSMVRRSTLNPPAGILHVQVWTYLARTRSHRRSNTYAAERHLDATHWRCYRSLIRNDRRGCGAQHRAASPWRAPAA